MKQTELVWKLIRVSSDCDCCLKLSKELEFEVNYVFIPKNTSKRAHDTCNNSTKYISSLRHQPEVSLRCRLLMLYASQQHLHSLALA